MQDKENFQQTKQTFIDKLKNYSTSSCFQKTNEFSSSIKQKSTLFDNQKCLLSSQNRRQQFVSPRFGQSLSKRYDSKPLTNSIQNFRHRLYGNKSQSLPQTSYSYLSTRFNIQQNHFTQNYETSVNQLSLISSKYNSYQSQQNENARQNFVKLQNLEKYLISSQKAHQIDCSLVSQKTKQIISQTIGKSTAIMKSKHKKHLEQSLTSLTQIDKQSHLLQLGIQTQSQLCQRQWCDSLDKINAQILSLNNIISQVKMQQYDKQTQLNWKIKEIKFNCQQQIEREKKQREQKDYKLHCILQRLIEKVGGM